MEPAYIVIAAAIIVLPVTLVRLFSGSTQDASAKPFQKLNSVVTADIRRMDAVKTKLGLPACKMTRGLKEIQPRANPHAFGKEPFNVPFGRAHKRPPHLELDHACLRPSFFIRL